MNRLECLGISSTGSQKPPKGEVTSAHAETHKANDTVVKKKVTDKPGRSLPVHAPPCSVQVSCQETPKPDSPNENVVTMDVCAPKISINITARVGEQAELAAPDEELKMKAQSSESVLTEKTHVPPQVEPFPMHEEHLEEEQTEDEDTEDEEVMAPVELIIEFLRAVMDRDFQLASKLCQMILVYEPDNPEANEFLSLIQKKLLEEQEGSNEEDEAEEDDGDEDDDDSDDDDENESDVSVSDEEPSNSSSSSCSSSSSSSGDEKEEEDQENRHKPCPPSHVSP
ncbi:glutamate-rich protein 2 isoform X3 [Mastacembelus armatus]|uniref:glutamate-rich protein 2 isoform X3 n=1 Tax=Mastacembelus armatus TaxID=205130 RepID=UPI000E4568EA|nr:glutamic acid-rich protein-like isoform X3 [Mastacembelus armatus]